MISNKKGKMGGQGVVTKKKATTETKKDSNKERKG